MVKYGPIVAPRFVSELKQVPVLKVFATMHEPEIEGAFVIMDYVDGQNLAVVRVSLTHSDRHQIADQLQAILEQLRSLDSPSSFGSLQRRP